MISTTTITTEEVTITTRGCQTLFYPGITCSQSSMTKYYKEPIIATSNQLLVCAGRNNLQPIDVLINPFIGIELHDVDFEPFKKFSDYFNPITLASIAFTRATNWYHGISVSKSIISSPIDVSRHRIKISNVSIGQETDIESHFQKYELWKAQFPDSDLILYGVSRGAATTFNALAKYKYPEAKLVILEGCFYSFDDVLANWVGKKVSSWLQKGLGFFTKYKAEGPSPGAAIKDIPSGVPMVFITSKIDKIVPASSTKKLAHALNEVGKNPVYLLELDASSHPNYMFDCISDREKYECFINALYQKYGFRCNEALAEKGRELLQDCLLSSPLPQGKHEITITSSSGA